MKNEVEKGEAKHAQLIEWFRQATPYINAHRGKTFVIMLSGNAVASDNIHNTVHDIVLLNSLGIKLVIVHGIRNQLEEELQSRKIRSDWCGDLRITDKATLDCAIQASSIVRSRLETKLSMGLPNSPMHGARVCVTSANAVTAKPAGIIDGIDLQHTGYVRKIDQQSIGSLLDMGNVVLLSPIGFSPSGEAFSLSHHHVGTAIANAVDADKIIAFIEQDGLCGETGSLLREVNPMQAREAVAELNARDETANATLAVVEAIESGVPRGHLMSFHRNGALLEELFTVDGAGTLVQHSQFEEVRQANIDDVPAIIDIIRPLEREGVLVRRDRDKLEKEIQHFTLIEREGLVIAVAALYPFGEKQSGEIACITTHSDYRGSSRGVILLNALEQQARDLGLNKVFVLTTQTTHWFIEQGFVIATVDDLPAQKQQLYNLQRNSQVLIKSI